MRPEVSVLVHAGLSLAQTSLLRRLFDAEYLGEFGEWDPSRPYGYAPLDVHVVAYAGGSAVGHVGFQKRSIKVGDRDVPVAGTGGVLIAPQVRGTGLGRMLMGRAQQAMRESTDVDFGYLGCREEVVGFYETTGWVRVLARERFLSRIDGTPHDEPEGAPIMICAARRGVDEWPAGAIDLRGAPW
jgi:aminoglycoside 2'-N-acetyltransferase I